MSLATFKLIKDRPMPLPGAVIVTLFDVDTDRALGPSICGWISGSMSDGGPEELSLPIAAKTMASIAVLRGWRSRRA